MQLDIFADSRDVMLRNDVLDALHRRHPDDARQSWQSLANEFPDDGSLPGLAILIEVLEDGVAAPFTAHATLAAACLRLTDEVEPAARQLLGDAAGRAWVVPWWRAVAQRAAGVPFRTDVGDHHAAPVWLHAGDWEAARHAVEGIVSWRKIPAPLAWMAEARYRAEGLDPVWPLLTELAWLSPGRLPLYRSGSPTCHSMHCGGSSTRISRAQARRQTSRGFRRGC